MTNKERENQNSPYQNAEELASLGLDRLKSALIALGLKCGGNLEARAERLFSTKGKTLGWYIKKIIKRLFIENYRNPHPSPSSTIFHGRDTF